MRHVDLAAEAGVLQEVRDADAVVHMEVSQQEEVYLLWVDHVEVWQCLNAVSCWMQAAV